MAYMAKGQRRNFGSAVLPIIFALLFLYNIHAHITPAQAPSSAQLSQNGTGNASAITFSNETSGGTGSNGYTYTWTGIELPSGQNETNSSAHANGSVVALQTYDAPSGGQSQITPLAASGPNYCGAVSCSGAPSKGSGASSASESCSFSTCYPHTTDSFGKSSSSSTDVSPATKVSKYNINSNGWLITCPSSPETHPQDQSWIDTQIYSFIAGNACQAPSSSFKTNFQFQASSSYSSSLLATTQASVKVSNPAEVNVQELTFSPQVDSFISTAFSNQSYIFRPFPTEAQSVSWYWYAKYANFFNVNPSDVPPLYIGPLYLTYEDPATQCIYSYTYTSKTTLDSIKNTYIPFTEVLPPDVYYPIKGVQSSGQSPPYMAPDSPSKTATFSANVYPYFIQKFNITNPSVPPNSLDFNATYDVYGPWLYYSPYNTIEPFPLDSNSLLYASYDSNLVSFMRDSKATAVNYRNAMQSNTVGANTLQTANIIYDIPGIGTGFVGGGGTSPISLTGSCPTVPDLPYHQNSESSDMLSLQTAYQCALAAGFSPGTPAETMVAIAMAESGLQPGRLQETGNGCNPPPSSSTNCGRGVVQIDSGAHPEITDAQAFTASFSFQWAYGASSGGTSFNAWCTWESSACGGFGNNAYCKYMPSSYSAPGCAQGGNGLAWDSIDTASGSSTSSASSTSSLSTETPDSVVGIPSGYVFALMGTFSGKPSEQSNNQQTQQTGSVDAIYQAAVTQLPTSTLSEVPYCYGSEAPRGQPPNGPKCPYGTNGWSAVSGGFDCSGLVQWAASQAGFSVPRTSEQQYAAATPIQQSDTVPGDLIFFNIVGDPGSPPQHVGICANNGCTEMIDAPKTGTYVREESVSGFGKIMGYGRVAGASASGSVGVVGTGNGEIDVLRVVNHGYYNTSTYQPTSVQQVSLSGASPPSIAQADQQWQQSWADYWKNVVQLQNGQTYLVKSIPISEIASAINLASQKSRIPSDAKLVYQPYNISADDVGDIFIIGTVNVYRYGSDTKPTSTLPFIARVSNSIGPGKMTIQAQLIMDCYQGNPTPIQNNCQPLVVGGHPDNIVAASPIGDLVFISGWYDTGIHVLSGSTLDYLGKTISLDYATDIKGGQPGILDVNVAKWLANGGLYGINVDGNTANDKLMSQILSQASDIYTHGSLEGSTNHNACDVSGSGCAQPITHHPLGITDINGYLYVMDNWLGQLDVKCEFQALGCRATSGAVDFDFIMLRVIDPTGVDVPISPTQFNDLGSGTYDSVKSYPTPPPGTMSTYPPYGWILSANVSAEHANYKLNLCSGTTKDNRCSLPDPSEYSGYFMPLGPHLKGWHNVCDKSFLHICWYSIAKPQPIIGTSFTTSFNNTIALLLPDPNLVSGDTAHRYGELLLAQFNPANYTNIIGPGGPPKLAYACYTDAQDEALGASGNSNPLSCFYDRQMQKITGPVYLMENPFRYTEGVGSLTTLTFEEYYGSAFSGTAGFPSALQNPTQNPDAAKQYINQNLNKYTSNLKQTVDSAANSKTGPQQSSVQPQATAVNAMINGYLEVPFNYSYTIYQTYETTGVTGGGTSQTSSTTTSPTTPTPSKGGTPQPQVPPSLSPLAQSAPGCTPLASEETTYYVTYTAATQDVKSKPLAAGVEAGDTYMKYFSNYSFYSPNISSITLPPTIITDILTNRLFGDIYVNQTLNHLTNQQEVVNAIMSRNYQQDTYTQGKYPGFSNIISSAVLPPCIGAKCAIQADTGKTAQGQGGLLTTFGYVPQSTDTVATLFSWYKQMVRSSQVTLDYQGQAANAKQSVFGYRRIVYAFKDRFNNSIFAPIDADTANITQIDLKITPVVDPHNANLTNVYINGTAFWTPPLSTQNVPLKNGDIYVYFAQNLNFVDYNPTLTYQYSSSGGVNGKENAQLCAFGDNSLYPDQVPTDCALANPIWQGRSQNAGVITYHPSYNAMGQCDPAPKSLLQQTKLNCNIYGTDGSKDIPALCPPTQSSYQQYCVPLYANGTGFCTSEVGLMGVAKTNSNGKFSLKEPVCGYGGAVAGVSYYGAPSPEPITVRQSDLLNSSDPGSNLRLSFQSFNYTWTPQNAVKSFQIGELLLSFGNLNAAYVAAGVAAVIALAVLGGRRNGRGVKRRS